MNKKLMSLLCIGFALSLASCGKASSQGQSTNTGSSDSGTTDTGTDTNTDTDTTPAEDRFLLDEFYSNLTNHSGIVTAAGYSKTTLYNDKAVYVEYLGEYGDEYEDYGMIVNGDQGTYEFTFGVDSINYGQIIDRSTDGSSIYTAMYTIMDLEETNSDSWDYISPTEFTTTDLDLLDMMVYLDGYSSAYGQYIQNPLLTFYPENDEIVFTGYLDLTEYLETDEYNENMCLTFSFMGLEKCDYIEHALENPVEQLGISEGYDTDLLFAMYTFANREIPSFNWSKESGWSRDDDNAQLKIYDYTIGCKVDDMVATLVADGWTVDEDSIEHYSGLDDEGWDYVDWAEGDDEYFYSVTLTYEERYGGVTLLYTDYIDIIFASADYYNDYYWATGYENFYPDGVFSVTMRCVPVYSYDELCNELRTLEFSDDFMLESLGFTTEPYEFEFINNDDYAPWYGCDEYLRVYNGSFDDQATALAQIAVAEAYLVELGFEVYSTYNTENIATNGYVVVDKTFDDGSILELQFSCDEEGGIGIVLMY